jgi:hypothetical protein
MKCFLKGDAMRGLKICLWTAGIGCLLSVFVMFFLPVSTWESITKFLGVDTVPDLPLFLYTARRMSAMCAALGVFFVILARDPMKYGAMVPFSGIAIVFVGMVCWITGLVVEMPPRWILGDSMSCVVLGTLIFAFWQKTKRLQQAQSRHSNCEEGFSYPSMRPA